MAAPRMFGDTLFWQRHLLAPVLGLLSLIIIICLAGWDLSLSEVFFHADQGGWIWRDNYWLTHIVHDLGHKLMLAVYVVVLVLWAGSFWLGRLFPLRSVLGYLLVSVLLCVLFVNAAKQFLHFPCPWDLSSLGGEFPGILTAYAWAPQVHGCFPSGHASSGYAWLGLYYAALVYRPALKFTGLVAACGIGIIFGVEQQVRGAHFLTHDIACILLCWVTVSSVFYIWQKYFFNTGRTQY